MKVLVDTSVWSLALRRTPNKETNEVTERLTNLILSSQAVIIGAVRQELLSGLSDQKTFNGLKSGLRHFDDLPISTSDHELAAQFFNTCRKNGIQGSHTDFLLCAVAVSHDLLIFTTDKDFEHYAKHLPIRLLEA